MSTSLRAWTVVAFAAIAAIAAVPVLAFDFAPTRYDDPVPDGCFVGDCSLREAVIDANAAADSDRILLSAGVYAIDLVGSGENAAATGDLDILQDTEIVGVGAGLTLLDAAGLGEPLFASNQPGLDFALRRVTVRNSDVSGLQLGIGTYAIEDCEIRDNGTNSGHHGISTSVGAILTLRRVSLVGNSGSGLFSNQSTTTVENSTFSGNVGRDLVLNLAAAFSCSHCTISDPADGDAEVAILNSSNVSFTNSIVAGDCLFTSGSLISLGGNIESSGHSCTFTQASDQDDVTAVALALGALAANGGATRTHLPGAASAAAGSADDALCLDDDQRGVVRTTDCESGAVELTNAAVPTALFSDGFQQGGTGAWSATVPSVWKGFSQRSSPPRAW